jgi:polyphosphate kinase
MPTRLKSSVSGPDLRDPSLYISRELSQLEFNQRVLEQAKDPTTPLLERLRFLCISCTNLDEFFEIRVAALRQQVHSGGALGPEGLTPSDHLEKIRLRTQALVDDQYRTWDEVLMPELERTNIRFLKRENWTPKQRKWLSDYFENELQPVLSPLGLDPAHPFPRILNKSLNLAVVLKGRDAFGREGSLALIRAPRSLPRLIRLPRDISRGPNDFVFMASLLHEFIDELFPGMEVKGTYQFRVTRNSELIVDEDEVDNLALALQGELHERHYAQAVRLELADNCPKDLMKYLLARFELSEDEVYRSRGPVNLNRLMTIYEQIDRPDLKFAPFKPRVQSKLQTDDLFETIGKGDVLLHHPFDSFATVVELLRQAAVDPGVLAIKQTLYRTGKNSSLVNALIDAARNGKDVTVVVELRARFDEEANIALANRLQEAGVQVVYGVVGFKTHAKMLLIVRRERTRLKRYVHLGTGNYHQGTASAYTDIGLLTAHREITEDVHLLFQQLSGLGPEIKLQQLLHSPFTLYQALIEKITREAAHAKAGKPARIIAKMNSLNEASVIRTLYEASMAGVEIDLIIRGTCGLKPGLPGISERIRVRSVVGRFLEHSRVFYFANDQSPELYCASADWLDRNLHRRVEVGFPILDEVLFERVYRESLALYLNDDSQAWLLRADGTYQRAVAPRGAVPHAAQLQLLRELTGI